VNEVPNPIICKPYEEPAQHWHIVEGEPLELIQQRRDSQYFYRPPGATPTAQSGEAGTLYKLELVNELRGRVKRWRQAGYPGVTRTTLDLLRWWQRDGRLSRFFFAQLEAAETIIFLVEARMDFRQGIQVQRDEPSPDRAAQGYQGFTRYALKMATGTGKTTVMGMLAAWSILNKQANRQDARFSEVVLAVCPNVTIRDRLQELQPERGDASIYRSRDIVPEALMPQLRQGKVYVTNWHIFEPKDLSGSNKVDRRGKESDTAVVKRILSGTAKGNVLVLNDEAHHAYRIAPGDAIDAAAVIDEEEDADYRRKEATIWIDGLDRITRIRGINFCVDMSATPYYLDRVGHQANTPFRGS
jgi:type III restriction enzyme